MPSAWMLSPALQRRTTMCAMLVGASILFVALQQQRSLMLKSPAPRLSSSERSQLMLPYPERKLRELNEETCDVIPMENLLNTWDHVEGGLFNVAPATGMLVYQNGEKIFERYQPDNQCPGILCVLAPIQFLLNGQFGSGGSPDKKFGMYSATKSLAGMAALLMVKKGYINSLDDLASDYVTEWQGKKNKEEITIRELLTLSSGILSSLFPVPLFSLFTSINSIYLWKRWAYGYQPFTVFGYLVEQATGMSGEEFLERELYAPLGIDSLGVAPHLPSGVTSFYMGGSINLPDMFILAEEIHDAALGNGRIFNPDDIKEIRTRGRSDIYGLSAFVGNRGGLECPEDEIPIHFVGAGGQITTVLPKKRLIATKSGFGFVTDISINFGFWDRLFEDVSCECVAGSGT